MDTGWLFVVALILLLGGFLSGIAMSHTNIAHDCTERGWTRLNAKYYACKPSPQPRVEWEE